MRFILTPPFRWQAESKHHIARHFVLSRRRIYVQKPPAVPPNPHIAEKGSTWVLDFTDGELTSANYLAPRRLDPADEGVSPS